MTRNQQTRCRRAPGGLLPLLALGLLAACTPAPDHPEPPPAAAIAPSATGSTAIAPRCDAEPAVCAEQQRKLDEQQRPRRDRVHPAGVTPPVLEPKPER